MVQAVNVFGSLAPVSHVSIDSAIDGAPVCPGIRAEPMVARTRLSSS
jgi:hypothetical protein